jgi:NADPH2:quinone reductase
VKQITGGAGVQVVYDSVGRTTFMKGLDCLARRGMMVLLGQSSGPVEPFDLSLLSRKGSLFVTRPSLVHHIASRAELLERASEVLDGVADSTLTVRIGREMPLSEAEAAHRELEGRRTTGKVLLIP